MMSYLRLDYLLFTVAALLFAACGGPSNPKQAKVLPSIYPDYVGVTIPATIAPLNFGMAADDVQRMDVVMTGAKSGELHLTGSAFVTINAKDWTKLLQANAGDSLSVTVCAKTAEGWTAYAPFGIYISTDAIDYGLNYRKLAPGYEVFSKMGIYERNLSSYEERALLENTQFEGCVNCHAYNRGKTDNMSLHIRGVHGATLLRVNGKMEAYNTATDQTLGLCVYPYWHPSEKYIAYSTNNTRQSFHSSNENRIEVFDLASDLQIYDVEHNTLLVPEQLKRDSIWETFPAFSPDGKTLYFCAAEAQPIPAGLKEVRYNLCKVSFDPATGECGTEIETLVDAVAMEKSVSFPKPSYDGRFLVYTLSDYGNFSIWHHEADLWLLDLQTGNTRPLDAANSDDTESYHNWSSNSRWMVLSSRRDDGLHTRLYICHMDENGQAGKAFMLPQQNPRQYYDESFQSYNVPEFVTAPVPFNRIQAEALINAEARTPMKVRLQPANQ